MALYENIILENTKFDHSFPWEACIINHLTIHRLLSTCFLLASKMYDDTLYNNRSYSKCGGMTLSELNKLEMSFLSQIDYKLTLSPEKFAICAKKFFGIDLLRF
jgi:hypothetical protein